jgi:hypothetical protein
MLVRQDNIFCAIHFMLLSLRKHKLVSEIDTSGQCYKNMMIVNDNHK